LEEHATRCGPALEAIRRSRDQSVAQRQGRIQRSRLSDAGAFTSVIATRPVDRGGRKGTEPTIRSAPLAQSRGRAVVHAAEPLPDFLTVEEAAKVLRIGRTAAYGLTRQWRVTGGEGGLPVVRFGRQLRVPGAALEVYASGPLTALPSIGRPEKVHPSNSHPREVLASRSWSSTANRADQLALFETA
jgi:excisionase family DNA binding protein